MTKNFDYKSFEQSLFHATHALIQKLAEKYGKKNLRAFCLYSDEDAGSSVFCFDTYENHKRQVAENDDIEAEYYKWYFGEWLDDDALSDDLDQISNTLFGAEYGEKAEEFVKHKDKIYEIFVSVLAEIANNGVFENFNDDFILMFGITDFEDKELELKWMKQLNNAETFNQFKRYRETY